MGSRILKLILFAVFLQFPFTNIYSETLVVGEDTIYPIRSLMDIRESAGELTIHDVVGDGNFFEKSRIDPDFRYLTENQTYWIRFTVKNEGESQNWFLSLDHNRVDRIDFFIPESDQSYTHLLAGDHIPFPMWSEHYSHPTFRFFLGHGQVKTFYLRFQTTSRLRPALALYGSVSFTEMEIYENLLHLFNFLITILFTLIILYLYKKEGEYRYLLMIPMLLVFFISLFLASGNSYSLWPGFPYVQDRALYITVIIGSYISLFFSLSFLQLKRDSRFFYRLFLFAIPFGLPGFGVVFQVNYFLLKWIFAYGTIILLLSLVASLWLLRKQHQETKIYLLFLFILGGGYFLKSMAFFGWIHPLEIRSNFPAHFYPLSFLVFLKAGYERYRHVLKRSEELEKQYNELIGKLHRNTSVTRKQIIKDGERRELLQKVMELMENGGILQQELVTLPRLSEHLGIRPDQLSELINQDMGMNFSTFINTIRIHRSCELMADSPEKTITEILYESGFNSKTPFNMAFREIMNMSPSDYRERMGREKKSQKKGSEL